MSRFSIAGKTKPIFGGASTVLPWTSEKSEFVHMIPLIPNMEKYLLHVWSCHTHQHCELTNSSKFFWVFRGRELKDHHFILSYGISHLTTYAWITHRISVSVVNIGSWKLAKRFCPLPGNQLGLIVWCSCHYEMVQPSCPGSWKRSESWPKNISKLTLNYSTSHIT